MEHKKPDPRLALKRGFMDEIMAQMKSETEKARHDTGVKGVEMDVSEVYRVYSNDFKAVGENNRLISALADRKKEKEERKRAERILKGGGLK